MSILKPLVVYLQSLLQLTKRVKFQQHLIIYLWTWFNTIQYVFIICLINSKFPSFHINIFCIEFLVIFHPLLPSFASSLYIISANKKRIFLFLFNIYIFNFFFLPQYTWYGWRFVTLYSRQGSKPSPWKRNAKRQNGCLRRPYK